MYNLCLLQPDFDSYDLTSWRHRRCSVARRCRSRPIERLATKLRGLKADELLRCDRDNFALDHHAR